MTVRSLLHRFRGSRVHVLPNPGNAGDGLVHRGLQRLCDDVDLSACELRYPEPACGEVLLAPGAGNLCASYYGAAERISFYAPHFRRVVLLPSSVQTSCETVRRFLAALPPDADVFARERPSAAQIAGVIGADRVHVDHDLAFEVDVSAWIARTARGTLYAFRADAESMGEPLPCGNFDVSASSGEWMADFFLDVIASFAVVHTDRAHVAIAAAMLGRETHVYATSYHKVRAIYDLSLAAHPHVRYHERRPPLPPIVLDDDPRFAVWRARAESELAGPVRAAEAFA